MILNGFKHQKKANETKPKKKKPIILFQLFDLFELPHPKPSCFIFKVLLEDTMDGFLNYD